MARAGVRRRDGAGRGPARSPGRGRRAAARSGRPTQGRLDSSERMRLHRREGRVGPRPLIILPAPAAVPGPRAPQKAARGNSARFSKRAYWGRKTTFTVPTGPLRCLPMMTSVMFCSSGGRSSL